MRPDPSMRTDRMPRPASWAARIVPDAPPPTIATGTRRSDFVVRPVLRICRAGSALRHVVVHVGDRLARRLREHARDDGMDEAGETGTHQPHADGKRADAMSSPAHSK